VVPRPTQLSIHPGSVNENQLGEKAKAGMVNSFVNKRVGVQIKLLNQLTRCAIPQRFCDEVAS